MTLDLPDFNIKEISVKLVENTLVVDAEHEERPEEVGHMYRRFRRRYILPRNAVAEELAATFSEDGVLVVAVPKKPKEMKQVGRPFLRIFLFVCLLFGETDVGNSV